MAYHVYYITKILKTTCHGPLSMLVVHNCQLCAATISFLSALTRSLPTTDGTTNNEQIIKSNIPNTQTQAKFITLMLNNWILGKLMLCTFRVVPDAKHSITPFLPVGVVKGDLGILKIREWAAAFPEILLHRYCARQPACQAWRLWQTPLIGEAYVQH